MEERRMYRQNQLVGRIYLSVSMLMLGTLFAMSLLVNFDLYANKIYREFLVLLIFIFNLYMICLE